MASMALTSDWTLEVLKEGLSTEGHLLIVGQYPPPPQLYSILLKGDTLFGGADCPQKPADRKGSPSFVMFFHSTGTVGRPGGGIRHM